MDEPLVATFDKYRVYAQKSCDAWLAQDDSYILNPPILPEYTKMDKLANQLRALTGKYVLKVALMTKGSTDEGQRVPVSSGYYGGSFRPVWKLFCKLGIHEWSRMFLPGYKPPSNLDSGMFLQLAHLAETGIGGFEYWRRQHHPDCPIKVTEQASRVVWFAICWAAQHGRTSLSLTELDAIWNYAMLYPYIDNFLDSQDPQEQKYKFEFLKDLRMSLKLRSTSISQFAYHPQRQNLLKALSSLNVWISKQEPAFKEEFITSLEILTVVEGAQQLTSLQDILLQTCLKGTLSIIPICLFTSGYLRPEDYTKIFNYGLALQLVDDLQDVSIDKKEKNLTVFTHAAPVPKLLSSVIIRTINYTGSQLVNSTYGTVKITESTYVDVCIARMVSYIVVEALIMNPNNAHVLPYSLMKAMKTHAPFNRRFMRAYGLESSLHRLAVKL